MFLQVNPDQAPDLPKHVQSDGTPSVELREKKPWQHYQNHKGMLIMKSFGKIQGWEGIDIGEHIDEVHTTDAQIIGLRMCAQPTHSPPLNPSGQAPLPPRPRGLPT